MCGTLDDGASIRYRGFFVLAQAASTLNVEHLRSFSVEVADATHGRVSLRETI